MQENTDKPEAHARVVPFTQLIALEPSDARRLASLIGPVDQNLKHLERRLGVHIRSRGNEFQISGPQIRVQAAEALLHQLYRETADRESIEPDFVHLFLQEAGLDALMAEQERPQGPSVVMDVDAENPSATERGEKTAAENLIKPSFAHRRNLLNLGVAINWLIAIQCVATISILALDQRVQVKPIWLSL